MGSIGALESSMAASRRSCSPRAPSIQIVHTLGSKVYICYLLWAIWSPRVPFRVVKGFLFTPGHVRAVEHGAWLRLCLQHRLFLRYPNPL